MHSLIRSTACPGTPGWMPAPGVLASRQPGRKPLPLISEDPSLHRLLVALQPTHTRQNSALMVRRCAGAQASCVRIAAVH